MPKHEGEPHLYFDQPPLAVEIYCSPNFHGQIAELFHALEEKHHCLFSNFNALVERFSRGERLSGESFRQERDGWAFRTGQLRVYGVYSKERSKTFVLSHAIFKSSQKLAQADIDAMSTCLDYFDEWARQRKQAL